MSTDVDVIACVQYFTILFYITHIKSQMYVVFRIIHAVFFSIQLTEELFHFDLVSIIIESIVYKVTQISFQLSIF